MRKSILFPSSYDIGSVRCVRSSPVSTNIPRSLRSMTQLLLIMSKTSPAV